jgi:uncharacterized protein (TIGR02301 family)
MMRAFVLVLAVLIAVPSGTLRPASAVEAPFDPGLLRLAEILGSLHFLRNLCGDAGNQWRQQMERLLQAENPAPPRRAQFIASFNRGYRSFEGTYSSCTASATEAIARYTREGEALSNDIAVRYGN